MTVYKREWTTPKGRKGSAWYWKFQINGIESHRRAVNPDNPKQKAKSEKEARAFEAVAITRVVNGEDIFKPKKQAWTFARFVEEVYKPTAKANHRSFTNGAGTYLNVLLPVFGSKLIDQISPFEIEQFKSQQRGRERTCKIKDEVKGLGRPIKNKTVNLYLDCLAGIFSMAVAERIRLDNPVNSVVRLADDPPINKQILNAAQEAAIIQACNELPRCEHIAAVMVCLIEGGFRPKEFFGMQKSQVNLIERTVTVISFKTGRRRRRSQTPKTRTVPITDRALPFYRELMKSEGDKLYPFGSIKNGWESVTEAAGVPGFWLRWLRDTAKHRWEVAGLGPFEIAKLLGNSVTVINQHYNELEQNRARNLMNVANSSQKEKGREEFPTLKIA